MGTVAPSTVSDREKGMDLESTEWLEPLVDRERNRELERYVKRQTGLLPPYSRYFGECPWILRADVDLDVVFVDITPLTGPAYLIVSRDNSCRFCYGASRMLMRMTGMSDAQITQLELDIESARLDPATRVALDYVRRISRSNPPPGITDRQALRNAGFSDRAMKELAFFACDVIFHNRFATLLALPVERTERLARSRFAGLFAPLFRRVLERTTGPVQPATLPEQCKTGPFAGVVVALDGIVQASILRKILDEAWASPHLSRRTKALIFAVIARGLGSRGSEREARRLLGDEGLAVADVEEILAHLASPALDGAESEILPYVRETLWYQPAVLQRRGRALRSRLTNAQFLETVGVAALANMVCRLSMALDDA